MRSTTSHISHSTNVINVGNFAQQWMNTSDIVKVIQIMNHLGVQNVIITIQQFITFDITEIHNIATSEKITNARYVQKYLSAALITKNTRYSILILKNSNVNSVRKFWNQELLKEIMKKVCTWIFRMHAKCAQQLTRPNRIWIIIKSCILMKHLIDVNFVLKSLAVQTEEESMWNMSTQNEKFDRKKCNLLGAYINHVDPGIAPAGRWEPSMAYLFNSYNWCIFEFHENGRLWSVWNFKRRQPRWIW